MSKMTAEWLSCLSNVSFFCWRWLGGVGFGAGLESWNWRAARGSKDGECLRTFQHTPGTYLRPPTNSLQRNSFHLGVWGSLGYAAGVCWGSLRECFFFLPTSQYSLIVHNNKYPTRKRIHLPPREKENHRLKSASWDGIWTRSLWRVSENPKIMISGSVWDPAGAGGAGYCAKMCVPMLQLGNDVQHHSQSTILSSSWMVISIWL